MAAPKRKKSKARTAMRKAHWLKKVKTLGLSICPDCGQPKAPHRVCSYCGSYKGREVIEGTLD